ncbi:hypothetical protein GQ54DRAFT_80175 [Martensiomyces pterosporus]|nr:hypothetical protein GQ54DRAFT_80175 [Martensiomyces pterosporus]
MHFYRVREKPGENELRGERLLRPRQSQLCPVCLPASPLLLLDVIINAAIAINAAAAAAWLWWHHRCRKQRCTRHTALRSPSRSLRLTCGSGREHSSKVPCFFFSFLLRGALGAAEYVLRLR